MNSADVLQAIERGLTQRQIADEFNTCQSNVRYWLAKLGLKTKRMAAPIPSKCKLCGGGLGKNIRHRTRCQSCNTMIRRIRAKNAAIMYLGGKCIQCGYDKHPAGLEFHHCKGEKDFTIGGVANRAWEYIKRELDKCVLLCSICHRIEHSKRTRQVFLDEAALYKGRTFE
jgi:hypothetical protein